MKESDNLTMRSKLENPLLAYLLKRKDINFARRLAFLFGTWIATIPIIIIMLLTGVLGGIPPFCIALLGLAYLPAIFMPMLISHTAAASTARLVANQSQEMLTLTKIPNETFLWSYAIASLYRWRVVLITILVLLPVVFLMAWDSWELWWDKGEMTCIDMPIGNTFCYDALDSPLVLVTQMSASLVALTIGTAGVYLLTSVLGSALGFWAKNRLAASITSVFVTAISSVFIGVVVIPEVGIRAITAPLNLLTLFALLLMALIPYALAFGLVRVASSFVRRPA